MAGTYTRIARTTITSDTQATGVTFSGIPATYKDLKVIANVSGVSVGNLPLVIRFNDDSGANYSATEFRNLPPSDTTVVSVYQSNVTRINLTSNYNIPGSPVMAAIEVDIFQYAGSKFKSLYAKKGASDSTSGENIHLSGLWNSTAAITSVSLIELSGGDRWVKTGTTYTLYGIGE